MRAYVILWSCVAIAIGTIGNGIALVRKTDAVEAMLALQEATSRVPIEPGVGFSGFAGASSTVGALSSPSSPEQHHSNRGTQNICDGYDGIMWVSRVIRKAGAGTLFFQSIVDSLVYAEKYNLLPWVWINDDENKPCYDNRVHGAGPNITFSHLTGEIEELVGEGKMACKTKHGTRPGPPDYMHLEIADHTVIGNGMWQSYFQPVSSVQLFADPSCASKPVFELSRSQVMPDMHRCSELAVRGWAFKGIPDALLPNDMPMSDWLWDHRRRASSIVRKYFSPLPWLHEKIEFSNPVVGGNCLAAHIRLTDKASGRDKKGLEAYRPYIEAYVSATEKGAIYIATDDGTVLDTIRDTWSRDVGSRIIAQDGAFRSTDDNVPTFKLLAEDKHRSNSEALVEIYSMSKCNYFVHGYSGMAEAVHYLNSRLHQRSANIDDPDGVSPKQFEDIIRAFEKMNVGTSIYSGNVDVTGMPETETKSDDTDNTTNVESRPISGSSPSKLVGASPNAPSVPVDGHLNGLDLFHIDKPPVSHVHCVGENFDDKNSYVYRSCEYQNLCLDLDQKQLVVYTVPQAVLADEQVKSSTQLSKKATVLAGSQPKTWFKTYDEHLTYNHKKTGKRDKTKNLRRAYVGRYGPKIQTDVKSRPSSYYQLAQNVTLLPYYSHPTAYRNPGHILWDEFLSWWQLLDIFGRADDELLLMKMIRPTVNDTEFEAFEEEVHSKDDDLTSKFLPLFLGTDKAKSSFLDPVEGYNFDISDVQPRWKDGEARVVCAPHGVIGSGYFADHGDKNWHGQVKGDYQKPHNIGRGASFRRFRSWMLSNIGLPPEETDKLPARDPYLILVSVNSSERRGVDFSAQMQALKKSLGSRANVQAVNFPSMGLSEQITLATKAAAIISVTGGGTSTAYFLPPGASLYLFYNGGKDGPKYLDWDVWNNIGDIRVHWLGRKDRDESSSLKTLTNLVSSELDHLDLQHQEMEGGQGQ
eukprot:CAMPEP_0181023626 /NCGR_PEP_ID=MMETSP1070-20121207/2145_1 /TAXON_ID=265543 /ORGANISM="Minutocellus polymorphus, Strain NH13" /LENGTH=975 /DNA_ID=CAMNT_0023100641 /DNA_START=98 /DNA_END=3025 /DNA_ORIENTATION=-